MAYKFIDGVNKVLERLKIVQGADGLLIAFANDPRANDISVCIQAWNEVLQLCADDDDLPVGFTQNGSFTATNDTKEYPIPATVPQIEVVRTVVNQTRRLPLLPYEGGFEQMILDQPDPTLFKGTPMRWTINPITSAIRFDMTAQPGDVGDLIQVFGTTRQALVLETDVFPVSDTVVDQLVAAVAQRWMQVRRPAEYSEGAYETALAAGLRWSRKEPARQSYGLSRVRRR